jgi:hypothetical protein
MHFVGHCDLGIEVLPVPGDWVEECRRCKKLWEESGGEAAEGIRDLEEVKR